jgi:hypothetical protein
MNRTTIAFAVAVISVAAAVAADRSELSPTDLIVGEWKSGTKTGAANSEFPNSREYFSPIDTTTKTGTRSLKREDGRHESSPYSVVREDKTKRTLEIAIHLSDGRKRKYLFEFDQTGNKMQQRMYVNDKVHIDTYQMYVGADIPAADKGTVKGSDKSFVVRVAVNDDTKGKPVHPKAEIWFPDHGSWLLKSELRYGGTFKDVGPFPSGTRQTLIIYPDSREGKELTVPYMMTDEMNPKANPRDMISIDFSDTEITVFGLPIKAATGSLELNYPRSLGNNK